MSSTEHDAEELPVLEWEERASRVTIPDDLRSAAGLEVGVYRWSEEKIHTIRAKRPELTGVLENLSMELRSWRYVGTESRTGNTRILFTGSDGRYYALTLGRDRNGSWNIITIVGSSNLRFVVNRLRTLEGISERNR